MKFTYKNRTEPDMHGSPMACDRETATIFINPPVYQTLTPFQKKFWTWHEKGHIILNTDDEIRADNYAFDKLAGTEFRSLKQIVEAAESLLYEEDPYHKKRIENLYQRALNWDKTHPVNKLTETMKKLSRGDGGQKEEKLVQTTMDGTKEMMAVLSQALIAQNQSTQSGMQNNSNSMYLLIAAIGFMMIMMINK